MSDLSAVYLRLPNWIGDVCMSLPGLELLLNSKVPVVVCARAWARELLAGYPLDGFVPMSGNWRKDRAAVAAHRNGAHHENARGLLLPDSLSSALVFRLAGLPSAGYRDDGRSLLLRWAVSKPESRLHAVESWFNLTRTALERWHLPIQCDAPSASLELAIAPAFQERGRLSVAQAGLVPGRFILIAPTATGLHKGKIKVWPHFDALTRALQQQGHTVAMCPPAAEVAEALQNAPSARLLEPLSLPAFATLAQLARLVICNDSGVSHMAAAAGARQLTLFGVTERDRTGPWSPKAVCLGSSSGWPTLQEVLDHAVRLATSQSH